MKAQIVGTQSGWSDSHEPIVKAESLPAHDETANSPCGICGGSGYKNHSGAWSNGDLEFCNCLDGQALAATKARVEKK